MATSPKIVGFAGRAASPQGQRALPARFVLRLQQTVGNREVVRLLAPRPVPLAALVPSSPVAPEPGRLKRVADRWRRLWRRST